MRKHVVIVIICSFIAYLLFSWIVIGVYTMIRYNTLDTVAVAYIYDNSECFDDYGEIVFIGRNVVESSEVNESVAFRHYTVETLNYDILVCVEFSKNESEWIATSFEIRNVRKDSN